MSEKDGRKIMISVISGVILTVLTAVGAIIWQATGAMPVIRNDIEHIEKELPSFAKKSQVESSDAALSQDIQETRQAIKELREGQKEIIKILLEQ